MTDKLSRPKSNVRRLPKRMTSIVSGTVRCPEMNLMDDEVTGSELNVGDWIRCRLYRGIPGLPRFCAQGSEVDFEIGRIEPVSLGGNQRFRQMFAMWAVELREVVYIGASDIVNRIGVNPDRPVVQATVVNGRGLPAPAPRALPSGDRVDELEAIWEDE